jgi:hypothetical protein
MNKNTCIRSAITNGTPVPSPRVRATSGLRGDEHREARQRPLQQQPWSRVDAATGGLLFAVQLKGREPTIKAKESGRSQALRQILAAVLAANARERTECCILAG